MIQGISNVVITNNLECEDKMKALLKKWNSLSLGAKATIAYLFASIVNKGIGYITTPLFTRILTSEEFGVVSVFNTLLTIIGIIAMFSFQAGVFNNGMIEFKDEKKEFSFSLLILSNIITIVVSAVLIVVYFFRPDLLQIDFPLLILLIIIFLSQPAYNFWITRQRFELKYKWSTITMISMHFFSQFAAVIAIKLSIFSNQAYSRLFTTYGVLVLVYLAFYIKTIKDAKGILTTKFWKFAFFFNLPLIPHYLSQHLMASSDKWMISYMLGKSQTSYYSVAYTIAAVVTIVWNAFNTTLVPITYHKCRAEKYRDIGKVVSPIWIVFAVACISFMLIAPELMSIMAPEEYMVGMYVIPPVIGGVFFQSLYHSFANINYYYKKTKYVMYASFTAAIMNIGLNYLLLPVFGFVVAGYTTLLSYLVQALIDYWAMKKVTDQKIYDIRLAIILTVSIVLFSIILPLTYGNPVLRYTFIAFALIACVVFRRRIIAYIKRISDNLKSMEV